MFSIRITFIEIREDGNISSYNYTRSIQLISLEIPYFYTQIDMEGIARLGQSQPYFYLIFKRKYYLTFISTARL